MSVTRRLTPTKKKVIPTILCGGLLGLGVNTAIGTFGDNLEGFIWAVIAIVMTILYLLQIWGKR